MSRWILRCDDETNRFARFFSDVQRTSDNQILSIYDEERRLDLGAELRDGRSQYALISTALHRERKLRAQSERGERFIAE